MFDSIVGHDHLKKLILKELSENRIPNGFLLSGPTGVGKYLFARELAEVLNCTGEIKPCGECSNCRVMAENEHPDIQIIDPRANLKLTDGEKKDKQKFRDVIDKIISDSVFRPSLGEKKVVIIDDAADLSVPAMNNLLKILEEPPDYMVLILITANRSRILPTIRSRTQQMVFKRLSEEELSEVVKAQGKEVQRGPLLLCSGSPGSYFNLSGGEYDKFNELTEDLLVGVTEANTAWDINGAANELIKKYFKSRGRGNYEDFRRYLDFIKNITELTLLKGDLELKELNRYNALVSAVNSSRGRKLSEDQSLRFEISELIAAAVERARGATFRFMNFELLMTDFLHQIGLAYRGIS